MKAFALVPFCLGLWTTATHAELEVKNAQIKDVIVNLDHGVFFRTNEAMVNPDGCKFTSWYAIDPSSPQQQAALSLLLAYEAQAKPITFHVGGCTASGYPRISYVF